MVDHLLRYRVANKNMLETTTKRCMNRRAIRRCSYSHQKQNRRSQRAIATERLVKNRGDFFETTPYRVKVHPPMIQDNLDLPPRMPVTTRTTVYFRLGDPELNSPLLPVIGIQVAVESTSHDHGKHGEHLLIIILRSDISIAHGSNSRPGL